MIRRVVVYALISLDGVAEDPDAFIKTWDDAQEANLVDVIEEQDAVILGRRSYTEWAKYWPESDMEPFATFINNVTKYVATSCPLEPAWNNAQAIDGDLVSFVRELKALPGKVIGVHASISIARALLVANLVDEIRLVVAPTLAVTGRRLFDGVLPVNLELTESLTSPSGHLLLRYRVPSVAAS